MGMPNINDLGPIKDICKEDVINLLLASIAMEELGLAHIINAEGEKIQKVLECDAEIDDILKVNASVNKTLQHIIKKEMLLQFKLENVMELYDKGCKKDCDCD
jgi:hypothetical protein